VRYPRRLRDRSAVRPELASLIDLAPTLAEWAGVPAAALPPLDGRSLAGLAEGVHDGGWRDAILLEQWQERRYAGVRTTTWKYIIHENGERELYDLVADPHELTSVAAARPEVVADLEPRIAALGGAIP
jgi:arylsulfatase A-like enzyme